MQEPAGKPFGKYLLLDRIAAGGMAEIFRAKYLAAAGVTKPVVIKRILPHYATNPAFISMFVNEARIAVGLSHGNIAQVFDFGEIEGEYYLAMEYVAGVPLSVLVERAQQAGLRMPPAVAAFVVAEACKGLHYAHTRLDDAGRPLGIVHRDVSPQNVLLSWDGEIKLVDFGIAKARSATERNTEHGAMKGKYLYFSPEQARGKTLDARSDVFSLGIVLYEVLTAMRPFDGRVIQVLAKIVSGEFPPPRARDPQIPEDLEAVVLQAMALRPENRYQSAEQMQEALAKFLHSASPGFSSPQLAGFMKQVCSQDLLPHSSPIEGVAVAGPWTERERNAAGTPAGGVPPRTSETDILAIRSRGKLLLTGAAVAGALLAAAAIGIWQLRGGAEDPSAPPAEPAASGSAPASAAPAPEPAPAQPGPADQIDPRDESAPLGPVAQPPNLELALDARAAVLNVPSTKAARMRLDPERTYRLSVEGVATIRGAGREERPLRQVFYFGERARGARGDSSFGQLSPDQPAMVTGLRALYAFIIDGSPADNTGALRVRVAELGATTDRALLVDPSRHVVTPGPRLARFTSLDPAKAYGATVAGAAELGREGALARRLLYYKGDGTGSEESQGVLQAGGSLLVENARELWLMLPDDDSADNRGELVVRLKELAR